MKISTFEQARQRVLELTAGLNEIRLFLTVADNAISVVNTLKGSTPAHVPEQQPVSDDAPNSWADRLIAIFKEEGKPLMPRTAMDIYIRKGWPRPDDRKELYTAIGGTFSYLAKRKKVLVKTDDGYVLKH